MKKNTLILLFLILLPVGLGFAYDASGMYDHTTGTKFTLLSIALLSSIYLFFRSLSLEKSNVKNFWVAISCILIATLLLFIMAGYSFTSLEIG
ncbi:MAG TPA: hypothetical protein VFX17_00610 [Patescibacteria group bacterium]|nr:hypothetical protein [Patescibacteria group bacterium]